MPDTAIPCRSLFKERTSEKIFLLVVAHRLSLAGYCLTGALFLRDFCLPEYHVGSTCLLVNNLLVQQLHVAV